MSLMTQCMGDISCHYAEGVISNSTKHYSGAPASGSLRQSVVDYHVIVIGLCDL